MIIITYYQHMWMLSFGSAFLSRYDRAEDRAEEGRRNDRLFNVQCECSARSAIPPLDDCSRLYAVIFQRSSRSASCPASHIVVSSLVRFNRRAQELVCLGGKQRSFWCARSAFPWQRRTICYLLIGNSTNKHMLLHCLFSARNRKIFSKFLRPTWWYQLYELI